MLVRLYLAELALEFLPQLVGCGGIEALLFNFSVSFEQMLEMAVIAELPDFGVHIVFFSVKTFYFLSR